MTDPARTRNTSKIICPFCGYEYEESYELIGLDLVECDVCGACFELESDETVTYTTRKPDWLRQWIVYNRNRILEAEYLTDPVYAWNSQHPVGTAVVVTKDFGEKTHTTTRSEAQYLPSRIPVIWLDGIPGCYLLDRVEAEGLA